MGRAIQTNKEIICNERNVKIKVLKKFKIFFFFYNFVRILQKKSVHSVMNERKLLS